MQERNVDVGDVVIDQLILSHRQIIVKKYQYKKKKQRFKDNIEQPPILCIFCI